MMETYKYKPDCVNTETANQGRDEPGRKRRVLPHDGRGTKSDADEWAKREQYKRYTPCEKRRITDDGYKMRYACPTRGQPGQASQLKAAIRTCADLG